MNHSHDHHTTHNVNQMAASATLHCLTGCAIGEVSGLVIGTAIGLSTLATTMLAVILAFVFGYSLSILPLVRTGMAVGTALSVVLAADTLSIAVMEVVDNTVMLLVPGALHGGLTNPVFWIAMPVALTVAYIAAYPVNRYLLKRNKGHALMMEHSAHDHSAITSETKLLLVSLIGFFVGGLLVALAV